MELYHLRTFVAVAEEGHLTRAAERLFISQPAVSAHIKGLEEELGLPLFTRSPKGMALTREGEMLRERAAFVLAGVGGLLAQAQTLRENLGGRLVIGLNTDPDLLRARQTLDALRQAHPLLETHLLQSMSELIAGEVRAGRMDAGFAFRAPEGAAPLAPELEALRLGSTVLRIIAPPAWQERLSACTWAEAAREPWVWYADGCPCRPLLLEKLTPHVRDVRKAAITDSESAMRSLVGSGAGLGLLHETEAKAWERAGDVCLLDLPPMPIDICFLYRRDRADEPTLRAVISALRQVWNLPSTAGEAAA